MPDIYSDNRAIAVFDKQDRFVGLRGRGPGQVVIPVGGRSGVIGAVLAKAGQAQKYGYRKTLPMTVVKNTAPAAGQVAFRNGEALGGETDAAFSGVFDTPYGFGAGNYATPVSVVNDIQNGNAGQEVINARMLGAKPYAAAIGIQNMAYCDERPARVPGVGILSVLTNEPKPKFQGSGSGARIFATVDQLDGAGERSLGFLIAHSGGGVRDFQLDFTQVGGARDRIVRFYLDQDNGLASMQVQTSTKANLHLTKGPDCFAFPVLTDSLGLSVVGGSSSSVDSYASVMGRLLGIENTVICAAGGCGYTQSVSNIGTVESRLTRIAQAYPDAPIAALSCGINDADDGGLQPAVERAIKKAFAVFGKLEVLIVFGSFAGKGAANRATSLSKEVKIKAAIDAVGDSRVKWVPIQGDVNAVWQSDATDSAGYSVGESTHPQSSLHIAWGENAAAGVLRAIVT